MSLWTPVATFQASRKLLRDARSVAHATVRVFALRYTPPVKLWLCTLALALAACGGAQRDALVGASALEAPCAAETHWTGSTCIGQAESAAALARAQESLAAFDVDSAVALLEERLANGPYAHALLVTLHEQLGIAYSYLKDEKRALDSFRTLLALEPGHLLSYTLSPQATFLYEKARNQSEALPETHLQVSWPQGLSESERIPLSVEVVSDPLAMLDSLALYVRSDAAEPYRRLQISLPKAGDVKRVVLPAPKTKRESVLELYGSAYDKLGNEVLLWFDAKNPRELPLGYTAPSPWYRKWWVWAAVGGVAAIGTGATVYALGLEPADAVPVGFSFGR